MSPTPTGTVRLGVIGTGRIAQVAHLPAALKAHGVVLAGVADPSFRVASTIGARYGVPAFADPDALLDLDIDAVLIAAPDRFHVDLGLRALAAGKHVLMEKPLAPTAAEAQLLVDTAASRALVLQTGTMKRHDPGVEYAKANLSRIGRILTLTSWYRVMAASRPGIQQTLFPLLIVDEDARAVEDRHKSDLDRYRLITHGAHLFDGLCHFAGDLDWLSVHTATIGRDTTWHGSARISDSGGLASFEITTSVHSEWSEGMDIHGELGHIRIRSPYVFTKAGSSVRLYLEAEGVARVPTFADTDPYKRQLEAFARAVVHAAVPDPPPQDGVRAVRLIEAAARSAAADGERVALR